MKPNPQLKSLNASPPVKQPFIITHRFSFTYHTRTPSAGHAWSSVRSGSVRVNSGQGLPGPNAACLQPETGENTIVRSEYCGYAEGPKQNIICSYFWWITF